MGRHLLYKECPLARPQKRGLSAAVAAMGDKNAASRAPGAAAVFAAVVTPVAATSPLRAAPTAATAGASAAA
jgi:hypothetical protein